MPIDRMSKFLTKMRLVALRVGARLGGKPAGGPSVQALTVSFPLLAENAFRILGSASK
jgi:hypothetical protein